VENALSERMKHNLKEIQEKIKNLKPPEIKINQKLGKK
jgi:hypothetical protein